MAGDSEQKMLYGEDELGPLDPADAFAARYDATLYDHVLVMPRIGQAYDSYGDGYGRPSVAETIGALLAHSTWTGTRRFDTLLEQQQAVADCLPDVDMSDQVGESRNLIDEIMQKRAAHVIDWLHSLRGKMDRGLLVLLEDHTADHDPDQYRDTSDVPLRAVWLDGFALRAREHTGDRPDTRVVPGYDILAVGRGRNGTLGVAESVAMQGIGITARVFELTSGYRPTVRGARRRARPALGKVA